METKHTQGDWKAVSIYGNWVVVYEENFVIDIHNNEANAKLIAAAPDLLCACEELISLLKFHGYLHSAEIGKAQQAIKKAKGE